MAVDSILLYCRISWNVPLLYLMYYIYIDPYYFLLRTKKQIPDELKSYKFFIEEITILNHSLGTTSPIVWPTTAPIFWKVFQLPRSAITTPNMHPLLLYRRCTVARTTAISSTSLGQPYNGSIFQSLFYPPGTAHPEKYSSLVDKTSPIPKHYTFWMQHFHRKHNCCFLKFLSSRTIYSLILNIILHETSNGTK